MNFVHRLLKFSVAILDIIMEGIISQIFYSGPSSHFMGFFFLQYVTRFLT